MSGRGECEMMTFNEKHRRVFPLGPTAFAYAKLDEYFGKLRNSEIAAVRTHGGFWGTFGGVGESRKAKIKD